MVADGATAGQQYGAGIRRAVGAREQGPLRTMGEGEHTPHFDLGGVNRLRFMRLLWCSELWCVASAVDIEEDKW